MPDLIVIKSNSKIKVLAEFVKIFKYRTIVRSFIIRDIKINYAQTKLGIVWSFIQAITAAIIVNFFFGNVMHLQIKNVAYIVYAFPGMMGWYYFSYMVQNSGTSLIQWQHIIKKVYFPKLILPFYKSLVGLVEFFIWMILLLLLMLYNGTPLSVNVLLLPVGIVLNIITGLSIAIWLCALSVRYRDALHFIPFVVGFGILATPVFVETSMLPKSLSYVMYFNPMAGVISVYRWCFLNIPFSPYYLFGFIPVILLLISGTYYFRKMEKYMSDLL